MKCYLCQPLSSLEVELGVVLPFKTPEIRFYKLYLLIQSPEAASSFVAAHLVGDRLCPLFAGLQVAGICFMLKFCRQLFHKWVAPVTNEMV